MKVKGLIDSLKNLDTGSLVDRVERMLMNLFIEKGFKVGDSIPTELELTEALGVSRTVIREAMLRLKMMGLVKTKKHMGSVITSPDLISILGKSMNPALLDNDTLKEIFEMRLSLEIGMADFIIERVTPEDIAELREIVGIDPNVNFDHIFRIDEEIEFHGKLYDITRNETLKKFQRLLLPVFNYVHLSGVLKQQPPAKKFASHRDLVDVIESGDAEALRNAMRNHLENHFNRLFSE